MIPRTASALLLALGLMPAGSGAAAARPPLIDRSDPCGCNPVLVGWGHSRGGQEWAQRYGVYKASRFLVLSLPDDHGDDNGGDTSWDGDALPHLVFTIDFGNGFAEPDSTMLDGAATQNVHAIRFVFSDRPPVVVHPYRASKKLRHRFPILRQIRCYIVFFSGGDGTLQTATAYDGAGRMLRTERFALSK